MKSLDQAEAELRAAVLASDIGTLDRLLGDDLVFTDQNGARLTKTDDLAAHRSGDLSIDRLDQVGDAIIRELGDWGLVATTLALEGGFRGERLAGTFAYTRAWRRSGSNWQVYAAHCSMVVA